LTKFVRRNSPCECCDTGFLTYRFKKAHGGHQLCRSP
jgi:hypothetical protein